MNAKLFIRKKDQYMEKGTNSTTVSSEGARKTLSGTMAQSTECQIPNDPEDTIFSINDLVQKILVNPDIFGSLTFQMQLPDSN